jgi:hypothetical protein
MATLPNVFRRKQMPESLVGPWTVFCAQAQRVEDARQALLSCLPVGRVDPAPIPVGLDVLRDELVAVRDQLPAWRHAAVEPSWQACCAAIEEALSFVESTRRTAQSTAELEVLLDAVTTVVEPLAVWQDAERAWRSLRT